MLKRSCNRRMGFVIVTAAGALACVQANAQWGSIRANNRNEHETRAPQARVERGREGEEREGRRETVARPEREVHNERNWVRQGPERHSDFDEDRRRGYFWSGISAGMRFNTLPSGYVPLSVGGNPYYYYGGAYYEQAPSGYVAVIPPVGAGVPTLPPGAEAISTPQGVYYYAGGAFYAQQPQGFVVAPPPLGVTVSYLPPGATQVYIRGMLYYQADGVYFMPVMQGGVTVYTTVQP